MGRLIGNSEEYAARKSHVMAWFLQRVTGALLLIILLVHIALVHFTFDGGEPISLEAIHARFSAPGLRFFYFAFLTLAVWHGINGLLNVVDDYLRSDRGRWLATAAAWTLGLYTIGWGLLAFFA